MARSGAPWELESAVNVRAYPCFIKALTVYDGELIAGGRFTTAGGMSP